MPDPKPTPSPNLQTEFNRWAADGRGDEMERHHLPIFEPALPYMDFKSGQHVLDLGCGSGWATRVVARLVAKPEYQRIPPERRRLQVIGVDISDQMVRRAQQLSNGLDNVSYAQCPAEKTFFSDNVFDRIFSIESLYYWPDQVAGLREVRRILLPGGKLSILINLYTDNYYSLRWAKELAVPVHTRSEAEYVEMLRDEGFNQVDARRIPDQSPTPDTYSGKWFKNAEEMRDFKRIGALLLKAVK